MLSKALRRRGLHGLQKALYWSGAAALYRAALAPAGAVILMYHSVPDPEAERWIDPRNAIPAALFARQMRFLARHRRVVALSALVEALERGEPIAQGSVVITFDDGYRDNCDVAADILAHYGLPATLYLATGYVTRGETQWVDRLYTLFVRRTRDVLALEALEDGPFDLRNPHHRRSTHRRLSELLIGGSWKDRESLLGEVASQLQPAEVPPRLTLTWEEVETLRTSHPTFEIGVHTRDHIDLVAHPVAAPSELRNCATDLERELGLPAEHFSFPYGRSDTASREQAVRAGFRSAVVTEPAARVQHGCDCYALPRIEAPRSMSLFRFWTSGAYPELPRRLLGRA